MSLHPLQQAQASRSFYKELLRFIQHGLRDFTGRSFEAEMPLLAGALAERVADSLHLLPNKPLAFSREVLDEGHNLIYRKYLTWLKTSFVAFGDPDLPGLAFMAHREEDAKLIEDVLGPLTAPKSLETLDPTQRAFTVAVDNRRLTKARQGALYFLLSEARGSRDVSAALEAEVQAVDLQLSVRMTRYTVTWLMFGSLIGGETLAKVRQEIVNTRLGEDCSIMGYLEPGECLPGRWACDDEDAFRANIAQYAEKAIC